MIFHHLRSSALLQSNHRRRVHCEGGQRSEGLAWSCDTVHPGCPCKLTPPLYCCWWDIMLVGPSGRKKKTMRVMRGKRSGSSSRLQRQNQTRLTVFRNFYLSSAAECRGDFPVILLTRRHILKTPCDGSSTSRCCDFTVVTASARLRLLFHMYVL